jgi:hypothetical protein
VSDPTTLGALQAALGTEHRAVYGYGVVGGRLTGDALADAQAALVAHANRRDVITRLLRAAGATPAVPLPAYRPGEPVARAADAFHLAVDIEDACAAAYAGVIAAARARRVRTSAIGWLRDAAVRSTRWRVRVGPDALASTPPLPGLDVVPTGSAGNVRPTSSG